MKRTVYLICITVITLICIVVGCYIHNNGLFSGSVNEIQEDLEAFQTISVDSKILDLTIEGGTTYGISCRYSDGYKPAYEIKGDTLTVTQKEKYKWTNRNATCEIIITVPENDTMKKITIVSNMGDIDIKNILCESLDCKGNLGDFKIEHSDFTFANVEADAGDIKCNQCKFENVVIVSDMGDVELDSAIDLTDYSMELKSGLGDIKVNGKDKGTSFVQKGKSENKIKITMDMGDIKVRY